MVLPQFVHWGDLVDWHIETYSAIQILRGRIANTAAARAKPTGTEMNKAASSGSIEQKTKVRSFNIGNTSHG